MTAGTTAGTIEKEIAKTANFINKHFNADFQCGQLGVLRRWLASNIEKDKRIRELEAELAKKGVKLKEGKL